MKKFLCSFFTAVLLFCMCGCQQIESIKIDKTSVELNAYGDYIILTAISLPTNTEIEVNWSSSNLDIVDVKDGKLFAKNNGECQVFATTKDGNFSAFCDITVNLTITKNAQQGYNCFRNTNYNIFYPVGWQSNFEEKNMAKFSIDNTTTTFNITEAKTADDPFKADLSELKKQLVDGGLNVSEILKTEVILNNKKYCLLTINFLDRESVYQYSLQSLINKDKYVHIISFNESVKQDIIDTALTTFYVRNAL